MKTRATTTTPRTTRSGNGISKASATGPRGKPATHLSKATPKVKLKMTKRIKKKNAAALEEYHKQTHVDPNHTSILFSCPRELLLCITGYLTEEAAISLTLTCKLALQLLGSNTWAGLKRLQHGRWADGRRTLMQYLVRDSPQLHFCENCNTLHPPLKPPRLHRETKLTKTCMSQWALVAYMAQIRNERGQGYSLVRQHIREVFDKGPADPTSTDVLTGHFTSSNHEKLLYTLNSSARWINEALLLEHTHTFEPKQGNALQASDILSLPLRLCPHQSTTTSHSEVNFYRGPRRPALNGPLLTYAIAAALPSMQHKTKVDMTELRKPTPLEQEQMSATDSLQGDVLEHVIYKCRGCPMKYRVVRANASTLVITTWHYFGRDILHASRYWMWFVRREATNLGPKKRNSEFWYQSQTIPDFVY